MLADLAAGRPLPAGSVAVAVTPTLLAATGSSGAATALDRLSEEVLAWYAPHELDSLL